MYLPIGIHCCEQATHYAKVLYSVTLLYNIILHCYACVMGTAPETHGKQALLALAVSGVVCCSQKQTQALRVTPVLHCCIAYPMNHAVPLLFTLLSVIAPLIAVDIFPGQKDHYPKQKENCLICYTTELSSCICVLAL